MDFLIFHILNPYPTNQKNLKKWHYCELAYDNWNLESSERLPRVRDWLMVE